MIDHAVRVYLFLSEALVISIAKKLISSKIREPKSNRDMIVSRNIIKLAAWKQPIPRGYTTVVCT